VTLDKQKAQNGDAGGGNEHEDVDIVVERGHGVALEHTGGGV
jgi:hypothetical protein